MLLFDQCEDASQFIALFQSMYIFLWLKEEIFIVQILIILTFVRIDSLKYWTDAKVS